MVESLFALARNEFFSVRIITRFDVAQILAFKQSLFKHFQAMDASLMLLRNRHLSATTLLARVALQINSLLSFSQDSDAECFQDYVAMVLPRIQHTLSSFIEVSNLQDLDTYLNLNKYTLWSDFDNLAQDQGKFLFTLESSRSHVIRVLCATGIVKPNLYNLITAKVSALVLECQRCDDLIHSYAAATYECVQLFDNVKSDLKRMISYLERPRARPIRLSVGRSEFERGLKDIVRHLYRRRFRWVSPEEKISWHYSNPRFYYRQ